MRYTAGRTTTRIIGLILTTYTAGLTVSHAAVIQPTVELPPVSGAYTLGTICVSGLNRCTENATVFGFNVVSNVEQNGDQLVVVDASYSADVFTNNGGVPGSFIGHLLLTGTAEFTYVGRNPSVNPLGTFVTELTDFDFTGMLNGNTFEIKQDPAKTSTGTTTILEITFVPPIKYSVSSSLDIFAEYSFNGGPFVTAPPRSTSLNAVPEPQLSLLAGSVLLGILGIASRRRQIS